MVSGKPPYTYLWNDAVTTANRSALAAGTYIITVTDSLQATVSDTVTLFEPQTLSAQTQVSSYEGGFAISSYGGTDGSLQLTVSGGTPPYTYTWSSGSSQATLSFIGAGSYSCIIEDAAGCIVNKSENLQEPPLLQASVSILQHVQCSGDGNGSATAIVSGGVGPYRFGWLSGESDSIAVQLYGGAQHVDVSDRNNVTLRLTFELNEPESFRVSEQTSLYPNGYEVSCSGCYNGSIQMNTSGGTLPYSILWADSTTELQRNLLGGGKYNYNMVDANGCEISGMILLTEPQRDDWSRAGNAGIDPLTQFIGTTDSSDLAFRSNNQEVMRIAGNGKIGIGTTNPQFTLDVEGIVRMNDQILMPALSTVPEQDSSNAQVEYKSLFTDNDGKVYKGGLEFLSQKIEADIFGECIERYDGTNVTTWKSLPAPTEGKKILYAGSSEFCAPFVGIGTNNPVTNFHLVGRMYGKEGLQLGGIFSEANSDMFSIKGTSKFLGTVSILAEEGTPNALIVDNGTAKFKNKNSHTLFIEHTSYEDWAIANSIVVDNVLTKALNIQGPATQLPSFVIYGDGNTIIGNDDSDENLSQSKLKVYGLISARKFKVTANDFPDYVFDENYPLWSLKKLKTI